MLFRSVLSTVVLVFWATFFEAPIVEQKVQKDQSAIDSGTSTPSIEKTELKKEITRSESINEEERIKLENNNIKGSISLEGAVIDDVIFKNYKQSLDSDQNIIFLNPKNSDEGYYIETGWASGGNQNLKVPDRKSTRLNSSHW